MSRVTLKQNLGISDGGPPPSPYSITTSVYLQKEGKIRLLVTYPIVYIHEETYPMCIPNQ